MTISKDEFHDMLLIPEAAQIIMEVRAQFHALADGGGSGPHVDNTKSDPASNGQCHLCMVVRFVFVHGLCYGICAASVWGIDPAPKQCNYLLNGTRTTLKSLALYQHLRICV